VIEALAREGGLDSSWWAGPEMIARMKRGEVPIQGQHPSEAKRLRLGFATEDFGFAISLGLPIPCPPHRIHARARDQYRSHLELRRIPAITRARFLDQPP